MTNRNMLLASTLLLGVAPPVFAQTAVSSGTTGESELSEIVVTATRRATSIENTPINITAISPDTLQNQRIDDVRELVAYTPGVAILDEGARLPGTIIMRGITTTSQEGNLQSADRSVGVYLGEVPLYADFKLLDMSRVETLIGPQGTLYGLGTLAGAVRYIPNRPDPDNWSFDTHIRSFGQAHSSDPGVNVDATANIPIVADHVAFRSVVGYYNNPGFMDYPYLVRTPGVSLPQPDFSNPSQVQANLYRLNDLNYEHTVTTRNQLLLQANDGLKAYLSFDYQSTTSGGRQENGDGVLGTGEYDAPYRIPEPAERSAKLVSAEIEAQLGDFAQLVSATAYTEQASAKDLDLTDLLIEIGAGYNQFPSFVGIQHTNGTERQFNQEIRLVSTLAGPFSWVLGGFYNRDHINSYDHEYVPGYSAFAGLNRPDDIEYVDFEIQHKTERAVYGELTYKITDAWQVTGGARRFDYDIFSEGGSASPLYQPYPQIDYSVGEGSASASGETWKGNTSYKFREGLLAYATVSKGYRPGGINLVPACPVPLPNNAITCALPNEVSYKPDHTVNTELGLRASLFDRRLTANVAVYHIDWTDIQLLSQTLNGKASITGNAGAAVSQGVELTLVGRVADRFTLSGNYSYNDAHLTRDALDAINGDTAFDGDRLPASPKNSARLTADYVLPVNADRSIDMNFTETYQSNMLSTVGDRGGGVTTPGYALSRASITYRTVRWDASIFANNIFDKYYIIAIDNTVYDRGTFDGVVSRFFGQYVGQRRTIGAEMRMHF